MNPNINKYFGQFGAAVPNNAYGLSEMVQFIWRSAIRNGEMIYLLIPPKRMYDILMDWLSVIEGCPNFRRIGCSEELIRWLCRKIPGYGKFLAEKSIKNGAYAPVFATKKHQSHFFSFGANVFMHLHTLRRESRQKETEPNILTLCSVAFATRPFCKAFPDFHRVTGAFAPIKKDIPTLQCRFCVGDLHPVPLYFAKKSAKPCS